MGQYFVALNLDRDEQLGFGMLKLVERLSNRVWTAALAYLLFEGPQDGTVLTNVSDEELIEAEITHAQELERHISDDVPNPDTYLDRYYDADTDEERERAIRLALSVAKSYETIDEANEYAGRWAGDRITIVGDYADSGLYDTGSTDISKAVLQEMEDNGILEWLDADISEVRV